MQKLVRAAHFLFVGYKTELTFEARKVRFDNRDIDRSGISSYPYDLRGCQWMYICRGKPNVLAQSCECQLQDIS